MLAKFCFSILGRKDIELSKSSENIVDAIAKSLHDVPRGTYIVDDCEWKDNS